MFVFLGIVIGVMGYFESDCPLFFSYYNLEDGQCQGIEGCYGIVDDGVWECGVGDCMYGYSWNLTDCIACDDEGARTCTEFGVSTSCWDGYFLDNNHCLTCTNHSQNCVLCDEIECTNCGNFSYLYDGECIGCDDPGYPGFDEMATDCTYNGTLITVTECYDGYTLTNYSSPFVWCVGCDDTTFLNSDPEASVCSAFEDVITITECKYLSGFCLGDDFGCHDSFDSNLAGPCTYNTGDNEYTATECREGYGLCLDNDGHTGCYVCVGIDNALNCSFTDADCDHIAEYRCVDEDVRYVDSGSNCVDCGEYCGTCVYDGGPKCTACISTEGYERGYYIDENDVCQPCAAGCSECVNNTECTTCLSVVDSMESVCYLPCAGHGACYQPGECECFENWWGVDECDITMCNGLFSNETEPCGEHGSCVDYEICDCDTNWYGEDICNITMCNGFYSNETAACEHGTCLAPEYCDCYSDWYGEDVCNITMCNGYFSNETSSCGEHGTCYGFEFCSCDTGWVAQDVCNITMCNGVYSNETEPCGEHGECIGPEICNCSTNWYGQDICNITMCNGFYSNQTASCMHGSCDMPDVCTCDTNWYGVSICDVTFCNGLFSNETEPCGEHGSCIGYEHCSCDTGWFGQDVCNITMCNELYSNDTNVCEAHGTCDDYEFCNCTYGYTGANCEEWTCDGVPKTLTEYVCYGHGDCEEFEKCVCRGNYTGSYCDVPMCNLISATNESFVCSDHGDCLEPDDCDCDDLWDGKWCEIPSCWGVFADEEDLVCLGHGDCIDVDQCKCDDGYDGLQCEISECFGTLSNESGVCHDSGICIGPDTCMCLKGFIEEQCTMWTCGGYNYTDVNHTCSGNGECTTADVCDCTVLDMHGSNCGEFIGFLQLHYTDSDDRRSDDDESAYLILEYVMDEVDGLWASPFDCSLLFDQVDLFGTDPVCFWETDYGATIHAQVELGSDHTVEDGTSLYVRPFSTPFALVSKTVEEIVEPDDVDEDDDNDDGSVDDDEGGLDDPTAVASTISIMVLLLLVCCICVCCVTVFCVFAVMVVVPLSIWVGITKRDRKENVKEGLGEEVGEKEKDEEEEKGGEADQEIGDFTLEVEEDESEDDDVIGKGISESRLFKFKYRGIQKLNEVPTEGQRFYNSKSYVVTYGPKKIDDVPDEDKLVQLRYRMLEYGLVGIQGNVREQVVNSLAQVVIDEPYVHPGLLKFSGMSQRKFPNDLSLLFEETSKGNLWRVVEGGLLDWTKKLEILYGLASVLQFLHSKNYVYKLLRTERVYLTGDLKPKIIDLRIPELMARNDLLKEEYEDETTYYTAPETRTENEELAEISKKSDIYSFGVVMYEVSFEMKGRSKVSNVKRPKIPSDHSVPKWFVKLVKRCTSREQEKRPTATRLRDTLAQMIDQSFSPSLSLRKK